MVDVAGLVSTYGPAGVSATAILLVGRWLLRAQVVATWIRIAGMIVLSIGLLLLAGVIDLHPGRFVDLYHLARSVIGTVIG